MTERAAVLDLTKYRVPTSTVIIIDDQSAGRMVLTGIIRVPNPAGTPADAQSADGNQAMLSPRAGDSGNGAQHA